MCQFNYWWPAGLLIGVCTFMSAYADQPDTSSKVEVVDSVFNEVKVKHLGEPIRLRYSLDTQKNAEPVDVYIAYSSTPPSVDNLWFIQESGFTKEPLPYYTDLSKDTEEIVLKLTIPPDRSLVGEHFFYAALLKSGTEVTGLDPSQLPWEKLSVDQVFVGR